MSSSKKNSPTRGGGGEDGDKHSSGKRRKADNDSSTPASKKGSQSRSSTATPASRGRTPTSVSELSAQFVAVDEKRIEREIDFSHSPPGSDSDGDVPDVNLPYSSTTSADVSPTTAADAQGKGACGCCGRLSSIMRSIFLPNESDLRPTSPDIPLEKQVHVFNPNNPSREITSFRTELLLVIKSAAPTLVSNLLFISLSLIDQIMIGHISPSSESSTDLAVAALALTLFNFLFFLGFGFASALDSLLNEAYLAAKVSNHLQGGGHGGREMASLGDVYAWFRRGLILFALLSFPIMLAMYFSYPFFMGFMGVDAEMANRAQTFLRYLIPGILPALISLLCVKYIQIHQKWNSMLILGFVHNLLEVSAQLFFIYNIPINLGSGEDVQPSTVDDGTSTTGWSIGLGMGLEGSAIATSIIRGVMMIILALFIYLQLGEEFRSERESYLAEREATRRQAEENAAMDNHLGTIVDKSVLDFQEDDDLTHEVETTPTRAGATFSSYQQSSSSSRQVSDGSNSGINYRIHTPRSEWSYYMEFFELALPGIMMIFFEMLSFDASMLLVTFLNTESIATHALAVNTAQWVFIVFADAFSNAVTSRIHLALSSNRPRIAKRAAQVALWTVSIWLVLLAALLMGLQSVLGAIFTDNEAIRSDLANIVPLLALFILLDGIQGVSSGVCRGVGIHRQSMLIHFFGLWVVGLLTCFLLGLHTSLGLMGVWIGLVIGLGVTNVLYLRYFIWDLDWNEKAKERMEIEGDEYL